MYGTRIFARNCNVKPITNEKAREFVNLYHSQGNATQVFGVRSYGLFSDSDVLLGVAIFCNPRTIKKQKEWSTELLRLAFKEDTQVVGGASKLIKYFIQHEKPYNFFTYQTLSGEKTDVYAKAGMNFISENKTKEILVKDGMTHASAQNNHSDWFSLELASKRGPDALLGTNLGSLYHPNRERKTNIELFQMLGYHIEEIPGDRVYGWNNSDWSFYCYKITSTVDDNYYIGRRALRKENATLQDCLDDSYFGSGGVKFKRWFSTLTADQIKKEIISIDKTWKSNIAAEAKFVGELYLTDPHCKNSVAGGVSPGSSKAVINLSFCPIHGEVNFRGDTCCLCSNLKAQRTDICSIHGRVAFQGEKCTHCNSQKNVHLFTCPTHGITKHQGRTCSKCIALAGVTKEVCFTHGLTKHQGNNCMKCNAEKQLSKKTCAVHGKTLHKGNTCTLCTAQKAIREKLCEIHGLTAHQGDVCSTCNSQKSVGVKECATHGLTKHQGDVCSKCNALGSVALGECSVHGQTKFQGGKCSSCTNGSLVTLKHCGVHGMRKHRGSTCYGCISDRRKAKKENL